jgi:C1A family cysteine protease
MSKIAFVLLFVPAIAMAADWIGADGPTYKTKEGFRGDEYATGLVIPSDWESRRAPAPKDAYFYRGELPKKWDWREHNGGIGPIRNQGNCGSCWAFSAYATMSDVLALHGKGVQDLSEQHLVSCDKKSYGCQGGWFHTGFELVKAEGDVQESVFPYKAQDLSCPASLPHGDKIVSYRELANGVAGVEDIKRAIYTYGPVSVAVSATGDFGSYSSGIYNSATSGAINHAVNLVGWDDTAQPPHWIMRNSWSASWGESGYMRIAYGSKKIGYAATYIDVFGPIPHDNQPDPTPTPDPTPGPGPNPEPCEPCTFWRWIKNLFD